EAVAGRHDLAEHLVDPSKQLLVLELLVGEADQRLESDLIAEPVLAADLQHLGGDEALDQAEDVGVGPALDLAQQPALRGIEELEGVGLRQPVGEKFLVELEAATAKHVAIDVPANPL